MPVYYWLGKTANGNVNEKQNWTRWSPHPTEQPNGQLPVSADNIPKYGDEIFFGRYNLPGGTYYPIFGPIGQLNGLCGPAGATALQWLEKVNYDAKCPVPLGSSYSYFKFRAKEVKLNRLLEYGGNTLSPSYIDFISGDGATKSDAYISSISDFNYTYYLKGEALKFAVDTSSESRVDKGIYNLEEITFSGSYPGEELLYGEAYGIEDNVLNNGTNSESTFYIGPNTSTASGIRFNGKGTHLYIKKGYSSSDGEVILNQPFLTDVGITRGQKVIFDFEDTSSSSGPSSTRSVLNLNTFSAIGKTYPDIKVRHGVDFTVLDQNGGTITFEEKAADSSNVSRILRGSFNLYNSKIKSDWEGAVAIGVTEPITCRFPDTEFSQSQNLRDLVLANFGTSNSKADLNGDGIVDSKDLAIALASFEDSQGVTGTIPLDIILTGENVYKIVPIGYTGSLT